MKSFLLHEDDGTTEADKKTNELHAFLHPICNGDTPHDFEGHNSGLSVWFHIESGDTLLIGEDGGFRVLLKDRPVQITQQTFPMTHLAMLMVEMDNGAHHINRIQRAAGEPDVANLECFEMPYSYGVDKLTEAENALYQLRRVHKKEAFETLITGEQSDQEDIVKGVKDTIPGLSVAHKLINDWFNAWEDPEAEGPTAATRDPDGVES